MQHRSIATSQPCGVKQRVTDPDDRPTLDQLEARLQAAKARETPRQNREEAHSQAEIGWRMVTELVAGLIIGTGIGYGLDWLFGTLPVFLILFTLLGFAAGVNVMLRSAKELQANDETGLQQPEE